MLSTAARMARMMGAAVLAALVAGCASVAIPPPESILNEDQIIDLISRPDRWYGRTVSVIIYPYDNGFRLSYRVCFERCDREYAESSPFVIYTSEDRFKDYRGDRPVLVRARYTSACVRLPAPGLGGRLTDVCPDLVLGAFWENPPFPE